MNYIFISIWLSILTTITAAQNKILDKKTEKKDKILTLTNGRYEEIFDQDSVQRVGNVFINIHSLKVVKLINYNETIDRLETEKQSRFLSVDPLTRGYPMLTPYQYAENQPIWSIDLDGLEKYIVIHYNNKYNQTYKTAIRGIRESDTKEPVNLQLKNANNAVLTTEEVYETTYYASGKIEDAGGRNSTKTEMIAGTRGSSPQVKFTDGNEELPYGNNIDETYRFQKGKYTSETKNADQYEFFESTTFHRISTPIKKDYYSDNIDFIGGKLDATGKISQPSLDGSTAGIKRQAGIVIENQINVAVAQFKKENPNLKSTLIDGITIKTNMVSSSHFTKLAKELEKRLNVKVNITVDNTIRGSGGTGTTGLGTYGVTTKVSGVQ